MAADPYDPSFDTVQLHARLKLLDDALWQGRYGEADDAVVIIIERLRRVQAWAQQRRQEQRMENVTRLDGGEHG